MVSCPSAHLQSGEGSHIYTPQSHRQPSEQHQLPPPLESPNISPTNTAHTPFTDPTSGAINRCPHNQPNPWMSAHPPTQTYPPRPPTISRARRTPDVITSAISSYPNWPEAASSRPNTRCTPCTRQVADLQSLPHELSDNSPAGRDTPPGRARRPHSQPLTQSAQPPPPPRPSLSTWLPGRRGIGLRWGACTPRPPDPASAGALQLIRGPAIRWGGGSGRRKTHVSVPGQEKVWFPPPSPAARR